MPHMPATGVSGLDIYARDERGKWRWVMVTSPSEQTVEVVVIRGPAPGMREYAAYLPLCNGVESLEIGMPSRANFEGLPPRPAAPIVLVEDRRNTNSWIIPARDSHHDTNHAALKAAHEQLVKEGVKRLFYIEGDHLLGDDTEGATDASHASDLGFMRQADIFEPVLQATLE